MSWSSAYGYRFAYEQRAAAGKPNLERNELCFIRKNHKCEKMLGASKSCFVACPAEDDLEPLLNLISEKLSKVGIEAVIAVRERAYGQDIFCTKICGKIIESQFCIVILDDTVRGTISTPNPNVYYEYGLMTSLGKRIIPLQRQDLDLAFNIQSFDTIKYTPATMGPELDSAIRDAVAEPEREEAATHAMQLSERQLLRRLELSGYTPTAENWFLKTIVDDTPYRGFAATAEDGSRTYAFVGKVDDVGDVDRHLEDLRIVQYRFAKKRADITARIPADEGKIAALEQRLQHPNRPLNYSEDRDLRELKSQLLNDRAFLSYMELVHVAFILAPAVQLADIQPKAEALLTDPALMLSFSQDSMLQLGDTVIELEA